MSIFAISDLHLSLGMDKPMDIFGDKWVNYTEKMKDRWNRVVTDEDWVIVPGDISWATYMEDAAADFEYINSLNGK
ncbi:MAG: serine/threonine protein phosphatase, partial [Clostridia bacterium]|nr:serine/threonine protein phosphatase [Clostridia bacterium]